MKQDSVKVVPFDKGTGFFVLDKDNMISKIEEQLGEAREKTQQICSSTSSRKRYRD